MSYVAPYCEAGAEPDDRQGHDIRHSLRRHRLCPTLMVNRCPNVLLCEAGILLEDAVKVLSCLVEIPDCRCWTASAGDHPGVLNNMAMTNDPADIGGTSLTQCACFSLRCSSDVLEM